MKRHWAPVVWLAAAALALAAGKAGATTLVFPDDPTWVSDTRGSGALAAITGANPRSGNGSLELRTTGDLTDWGFYRRDSGAAPWGPLADLDRLGFDWYRQAVSASFSDVPWEAQTPVLRLYVRDQEDGADVVSELVWEGFYNTGGTATTNDVWLTEDLSGQRFWRYVQGQGATVEGGENEDPFFPDPLLVLTLVDWADYLAGAEVWGIGVGVGSNWPAPYRGFADNVQLGFGGAALAVDDNFELRTLPEPGSGLLFGTGLAGLAALVRRRRDV